MKLPTASKHPLAKKCMWPFKGPSRSRRQGTKWTGHGKAVSVMAECIGAFCEAPVDAIAKAEGVEPETLAVANQQLKNLLNKERSDHAWRWAEIAIIYDPITMEARLGGFGRDIDKLTKSQRAAWDRMTMAHRAFRERREHEYVWFIDLLYGFEPMTMARDETGQMRMYTSGKVVARDYKAGASYRNKNPIDMPQMQAYAAALGKLLGLDEITVELALVIDDGTDLRFDTMGVFDLIGARDNIKTITERYISDEPCMPNMGPWCKDQYCPELEAMTCPAQAARLKKAVRDVDDSFDFVSHADDFVSDEHVAWQWDACAAIRRAMGTSIGGKSDLYPMKEAVISRVRRSPVTLRNGKVLRLQESETTTVKPTQAAIEVLNMEGYGDAVRTVHKTSASAIREEVKKTAPKGQGAAMHREVMAKLETVGAVKTSTFSAVMEVTPEPKESESRV